MSLKAAGIYCLLFGFCGSLLSQQTFQDSNADATLSREIAIVIRLVDSLHPGMTRADVLKNFTTEGGLSARSWNHYVYKKCPFIKIDVTFAVAAEESLTNEAATDKIATVSKPYLQFSIYD
ncbi:MAG: hypothetical protein ABSA39_14725 [Edaphobacter sp.]